MLSPQIIFEDKNIIALNKPAGYLSHPIKMGDLRPSITGWLAEKYPYLKKVGAVQNRFAIVHRLDRETSGIILAAKNQGTFENLQSQFKERKVKKEYIALVAGTIKKGGIIDKPLVFFKNKKEFKIKALSVNKNTPGDSANSKKIKKIRQAQTVFQVLENYDSYTLLKVFPQTGRTHQIRVHFKSINHPIVGDRKYNKKSDAPRLFLHASAIEFSYPEGRKIRLEAPLPEDFTIYQCLN